MQIGEIISCSLCRQMNYSWQIQFLAIKESGETGQYSLIMNTLQWKSPDDLIEVEAPGTPGGKVLLTCPQQIRVSAFGVR